MYIYTNISHEDEFKTLKRPDGFDEKRDVLVADWTNRDNSTLHAYQAHKVGIGEHASILKCLLQYDRDFNTPWERTLPSLMTEWVAHDLFAFFHESSQNVDFDNREEGFTIFDYIGKAWNRRKMLAN